MKKVSLCLALCLALCLLVVTGTPALRAGETLSAAEVQLIVDQASTWAASVSPDSLIAVVDREGNVLTVWDTAPGTVPTSAEIGEVISRAGVACFLNSNQNALTSRTAGFIVQPNFPPGFTNRINGPLIGVNNSHYPWSDINRFRQQPFPAVPANPAVAPGLGGLFPTPPSPVSRVVCHSTRMAFWSGASVSLVTVTIPLHPVPSPVQTRTRKSPSPADRFRTARRHPGAPDFL
jgi:hypothetical protein